jgi:hypothetical protein
MSEKKTYKISVYEGGDLFSYPFMAHPGYAQWVGEALLFRHGWSDVGYNILEWDVLGQRWVVPTDDGESAVCYTMIPSLSAVHP